MQKSEVYYKSLKMFSQTPTPTSTKTKFNLLNQSLSNTPKIRNLCCQLFSDSTEQGLSQNPSSGKLTSALYRLPSCKLKIVKTLQQLTQQNKAKGKTNKFQKINRTVYYSENKETKEPLNKSEVMTNLQQLIRYVQSHQGIVERTAINTNETNYNSKFLEIQSLKSENEQLYKRISRLEAELQKIDEFKYALEQKQEASQFNSKRIDLLKAQILQQRKQIKKINKTLRMAKIFHKEIVSTLLLFRELAIKYEEIIQKQDRITRIQKKNTECQLSNMELKVEEIQQQKTAGILDQVMYDCGIMQGDQFGNIFMEAFEKVKQYEKQNEELSKLFNFPQSKTQNECKNAPLQYSYPYKKFITKFKKLFELKTVFNIIDPKEKEQIDRKILKLISFSQKIEEMFNQLKNIDTLKNNPYYIARKNIPSLLFENQESFKKFLIKNNKLQFIILDYNKINVLEQNLQQLLNDLVKFSKNMYDNKNNISLNQISELQNYLAQSIESLVCLGLNLNSKKSDIYFYDNQQTQDNSNLLFYDSNQIQMNFQDTFQLQKQQLQHIHDINENNQQLIKQINQLQYNNNQLNKFYEQCNFLRILNQINLDKQKQYQMTYIQSLEQLQTFVTTKAKSIDKFLNTIVNKLNPLNESFTNLFDKYQGNDIPHKAFFPFQIKFKKAIREISEMISLANEKYVSQIPHDLRTIDEQYQGVLQEETLKWKAFNKDIENQNKLIISSMQKN